MRTLIAIPCMSMLHTEFCRCMLDLKKDPDLRVCFKTSSLIYDSRNLLALTAMEQGFDRVMWLDSDMTFPPDIIERLGQVMDEGNYDLVTGVYVKRKEPVIPVLYKEIEPPSNERRTIEKCVIDYLDYPEDSVFPIAGCGFGCVMTSVDLLRRIFDRCGPAFSPLPWCGEDISFCYRAKSIGAKMACDSSVNCGHIGEVLFTPHIFLKNRGEKN